LNVTFEHNATAVAEIAAWRAGTARQIRLQFDGSGSKYARFDMAGKWEKFDKIGEKDVNDNVTGTFVACYDTTASKIAIKSPRIIIWPFKDRFTSFIISCC
jgi:hypothetical protein